jgi:hypothetical protein
MDNFESNIGKQVYFNIENKSGISLWQGKIIGVLPSNVAGVPLYKVRVPGAQTFNVNPDDDIIFERTEENEKLVINFEKIQEQLYNLSENFNS